MVNVQSRKNAIELAMILVYEKPDLYAMWLLNIDYNLDLMWFDGAGNLVYKVKDGHRCTNTFDASDCTYKNTGTCQICHCCNIGVHR